MRLRSFSSSDAACECEIERVSSTGPGLSKLLEERRLPGASGQLLGPRDVAGLKCLPGEWLLPAPGPSAAEPTRTACLDGSVSSAGRQPRPGRSPQGGSFCWQKVGPVAFFVKARPNGCLACPSCFHSEEALLTPACGGSAQGLPLTPHPSQSPQGWASLPPSPLGSREQVPS